MDLKEFGRDVRANLTDEQVEEFAAAVPAAIVTLTLLFKARKAAKAGNYPRAIYYAVMWAGTVNNYNQTVALRQTKRREAKRYITLNGSRV